ncbi:hypothetical protein GE061_016943 [Apolygus lucorum]|uniref:Peptidase S1 domain-containing protein n=1 Tax=Apolygus lucorum TaxID=248454 RepID=A0A8S9XKA4_APOLU|nr:hypothetical protein GE061_016943 [Apolygus lucorum]
MSGIRRKRIIYGHIGERLHRDYYQSFRYYIFLAKGSELDHVANDRFLAYAMGLTFPNPSNLVCGGVLLTPSIVQTACHCLSTFHTKPGDDHAHAFPKNVWEDRIYSYFGANLATEMWDQLRPKLYITYSKCKQFVRFEKLDIDDPLNLFDFGIIISSDTIVDKNPDAKISYAPIYKAADMLDFYYKAIEKEFTCLLIGHGYYSAEFDEHHRIHGNTECSNEIRWGWRSVMSYLECLSVTYTVQVRRETEDYFDYPRYADWVCAQSKNPIKWPEEHVSAPGDSGGPMSCNGVYFSIFSMASYVEADTVVSYSGPIVHTLYENSVEHRDAFIQYANDFIEDKNPVIHPPDNRFTPTPPIDFRGNLPVSSGFRKSEHLISPLLTLCISIIFG